MANKEKPMTKKKYHDFMEDGEHREQDFSVDVTRDFLPSRERQRRLIAMVNATVPLLTDHQVKVLGLLSQGQSYEEIGKSMKISKGAVQETVEAIRKKVEERVTKYPYDDEAEGI